MKSPRYSVSVSGKFLLKTFHTNSQWILLIYSEIRVHKKVKKMKEKTKLLLMCYVASILISWYNHQFFIYFIKINVIIIWLIFSAFANDSTGKRFVIPFRSKKAVLSEQQWYIFSNQIALWLNETHFSKKQIHFFSFPFNIVFVLQSTHTYIIKFDL